MTATRRSARTSRSRTSRGGWRAAAWPCCASIRSPTPTRKRSYRTAASPSPMSTCPRPLRRSACCKNIPPVAAAEPSVAGLVIMAGGTQPMHWAAVRQVRYIASLNLETAAASEPAIEAMTRQAKTVDSPDLSPSTPDSELPFGVPAPYWLDLRGYDPAAAAAALD